MVMTNNIYKRYQQDVGSSRPAGINPGSGSSHKLNISGNAGSNAYQKYQQNSVYTASPQELTLMLYNGLVRFLKLACQGIEEKNMEKANNNLIKSQNIVTEFMCTLDMQYEVSEGLMAIYDYMNRRLIEANIRKDKEIVEEITGYAEELRDTWAQAMKLAKKQAAENE